MRRRPTVLPAPSLEEMKRTLGQERTPIIGLLFAPPYTKVAAEQVVPRLGYLDARSASYIHFLCAGYGGYMFAEDLQPIGDMRYSDSTVIPWGFSQRKFASFVDEIQRITTWKYSGEADLILTRPDLEFTDCIVYDIASMARDGAIDTPSRLFETIINYAQDAAAKGSVMELSDKKGIALLGEAAAEGILSLVPKALRHLWKRGLHYRTRNLARA
ncbi:MAG: hypothetical protein ACYS9X_05250 [Planctomycetota bacterium]|jgi:hypothetical protein